MPTVSTGIGALIARDPALRGGHPIVSGTGICMRTIATANNQGLSTEEIVADRPHLSLAQVYAALAYYHSNGQEIVAEIATEDQFYVEGLRSSPLPLRP